MWHLLQMVKMLQKSGWIWSPDLKEVPSNTEFHLLFMLTQTCTKLVLGPWWKGNVKMVLSYYSLNVSYSVKGNSSSPYQHIIISLPYMMSTEDVSWSADLCLSISNRLQSGREFTVSISSKQRQQKLRWLEFRDMACLFELCSTLKPYEFSSSYSTKDMNSPRQVMLPT